MRVKFPVIALGLAAALTLTACSGDSGGGESTSTGGSGAALTIAKPDGAITTESNNPFLGDSSASMYGYRYAMF